MGFYWAMENWKFLNFFVLPFMQCLSTEVDPTKVQNLASNMTLGRFM